jgi:hypothetical protein
MRAAMNIELNSAARYWFQAIEDFKRLLGSRLCGKDCTCAISSSNNFDSFNIVSTTLHG